MRRLVPLAVLPIVLALAACGQQAQDVGSAPTVAAPAPSAVVPVAPPTASAVPSSTPTAATPTPKPSATISGGALPKDAVLAVTAVAHKGKESVSLRMVVLRSTAWNDPKAKDRAALMTTVCDGSLDASVYKANLWSFTRVLVTTGAPWPDLRVDLIPTTAHLSIAAASDMSISDDDDVDQATPYCKRDKYLATQGDSSMVVGFQGDTDAVGAAGAYTKWANHPWGFTAMSGVTITDCAYELTPLGKSLRASATDWGVAAGKSNCFAGYLGGEDDDS